MECLFCKIAKKEIEAKIIYEDDKTVAFNDAHPQAPQHKLIIPKKHIPTLNDLDENNAPIIGHMTLIAKKLAKELGIDEEGYRVLMNCNHGAGQTVFHVHMHLLGGRRMHWPPG